MSVSRLLPVAALYLIIILGCSGAPPPDNEPAVTPTTPGAAGAPCSYSTGMEHTDPPHPK